MGEPAQEGAKLRSTPVWLPFWLTAPLGIAFAGITLMVVGESGLGSRWDPVTVALTHLATLGFVTLALMGSVYAVCAERGLELPAPRLGYAVHLGMATGIAALCFGLGFRHPAAVFHAIAVLALALLAFLIPLARTCLRARRRDLTAAGLVLPVAAFFVAASLGLWVAHGYSGMRFPGPRDLWVQVHIDWALLGWVGGVLLALSGELLPSLGFGPGPRDTVRRACRGALILGLTAPLVILFVHYFAGWRAASGNPTVWTAWATLPAALAVWGLLPITTWLDSRGAGTRHAAGGAAWRAALVVAPIAGLLAVAALLGTDSVWARAFGWTAVWGWAGLAVHALLLALPGRLLARAATVDGSQRALTSLHLASWLLGLVVIFLGGDGLARLLGGVLLVLGIGLEARLLKALRP